MTMNASKLLELTEAAAAENEQTAVAVLSTHVTQNANREFFSALSEARMMSDPLTPAGRVLRAVRPAGSRGIHTQDFEPGDVVERFGRERHGSVLSVDHDRQLVEVRWEGEPQSVYETPVDIALVAPAAAHPQLTPEASGLVDELCEALLAESAPCELVEGLRMKIKKALIFIMQPPSSAPCMAGPCQQQPPPQIGGLLRNLLTGVPGADTPRVRLVVGRLSGEPETQQAADDDDEQQQKKEMQEAHGIYRRMTQTDFRTEDQRLAESVGNQQKPAVHSPQAVLEEARRMAGEQLRTIAIGLALDAKLLGECLAQETVIDTVLDACCISDSRQRALLVEQAAKTAAGSFKRVAGDGVQLDEPQLAARISAAVSGAADGGPSIMQRAAASLDRQLQAVNINRPFAVSVKPKSQLGKTDGAADGDTLDDLQRLLSTAHGTTVALTHTPSSRHLIRQLANDMLLFYGILQRNPQAPWNPVRMSPTDPDKQAEVAECMERGLMMVIQEAREDQPSEDERQSEHTRKRYIVSFVRPNVALEKAEKSEANPEKAEVLARHLRKAITRCQSAISNPQDTSALSTFGKALRALFNFLSENPDEPWNVMFKRG